MASNGARRTDLLLRYSVGLLGRTASCSGAIGGRGGPNLLPAQRSLSVVGEVPSAVLPVNSCSRILSSKRQDRSKVRAFSAGNLKGGKRAETAAVAASGHRTDLGIAAEDLVCLGAGEPPLMML